MLSGPRYSKADIHDMMGTIFDIKEMAVHDGPGIRTTVFFKGCPLRCRWCHNPEGLTSEPQLMFKSARCKGCGACLVPCSHNDCKEFGRCLHVCPENALEVSGRHTDANALAKELIKGADILGESFGGFTFSGGEPTAQMGFLLSLAKELKNYHLCIETCGYTGKENWQKILDTFDFIIMDIKLADDEQHKKYTGVSNKMILENFEMLKSCKKPYIIRTPLIPDITDTDTNLDEIKRIIGDSVWEKLPYNAAAGAKYKMLGMEYTL